MAPTVLGASACRARATAARALTASPPVRASSMATARKIRLSVRAPTVTRGPGLPDQGRQPGRDRPGRAGRRAGRAGSRGAAAAACPMPFGACGTRAPIEGACGPRAPDGTRDSCTTTATCPDGDQRLAGRGGEGDLDVAGALGRISRVPAERQGARRLPPGDGAPQRHGPVRGALDDLPAVEATVVPAPYTLSSASGHHRAIRAVNTSNAVCGSASTSISCGSAGRCSRAAPLAPVAYLGGVAGQLARKAGGDSRGDGERQDRRPPIGWPGAEGQVGLQAPLSGGR